MYLREVTCLSVTDLLTMGEAVRDWFRVASDGAGPEEAEARERLYKALKSIFIGRSFGGMDPAHDPSGSAQHEWEKRRDRFVRDVALVRPWDSTSPAYLRAGPMVAPHHEVENWTSIFETIGLDWEEIETRARELAPRLPAEELAVVDKIVSFLQQPTPRTWDGDVQPTTLAKRMGVTWEALLKKSRYLKWGTLKPS